MATTNGTNGEVKRPKVLCPEKLSPDGLALLRQTLTVDEKQGLSPEELINIIPEYDALLVRSETKVTAQLLNAARNLKVVARAGVGVDNVDVPAATRLGIVVVNSPSGNIQAAAEHTIALLMSMARNIPDACASLKAGKWERSRLVGVEVKGKTLGIIGLGKGKCISCMVSTTLRSAYSRSHRRSNGKRSRHERQCSRSICVASSRRRCKRPARRVTQ
jgi:D-3-phosphoglycerate dehydrogenase / 2-oxoglutarate reductase